MKQLRVLLAAGLLLSACGDDSDKGKSSDAGGDAAIADAGRKPASDAGDDAATEDAGTKPASDAGDGAAIKDASREPMIGVPYNECKVASDCAWGEIKNEILQTADCVCLYGCPYLPLAKSTVTRRVSQHDALCDPRRDGNGDFCGIDDCAGPPTIVCEQAVCAAIADAGRPWR